MTAAVVVTVQCFLNPLLKGGELHPKCCLLPHWAVSRHRVLAPPSSLESERSIVWSEAVNCSLAAYHCDTAQWIERSLKLKFHWDQFLVTSPRTCWRRRKLPRNKLATSYEKVSMSRWSESRQLPRNFLVTSWRHARHARIPRNLLATSP